MRQGEGWFWLQQLCRNQEVVHGQRLLDSKDDWAIKQQLFFLCKQTSHSAKNIVKGSILASKDVDTIKDFFFKKV